MSRRTPFSAVALLLTTLLVLGALHPPAATAKPKNPPYRIGIHASATTVPVGQTIVFTGRVRPKSKALTHQNVKLQVVYDAQIGFETTGLDEPNRKGKYEISWHINTPGTYQFRARIAAGKNHSEGISEVLTVTVV